RPALLELETAGAGQPHVEHQARWRSRTFATQEVVGGSEGGYSQTDRAQQILQRAAHRVVVVDHEYHGVARGHDNFTGSTGRTNWNVAPGHRWPSPRSARRGPR